MEQSAAFITRYGLYSLLKDDMKDFFCSQEAEIATPSPDLSYVPYTGTNFSIVILIYLQKYLYPKIFINKNICFFRGAESLGSSGQWAGHLPPVQEDGGLGQLK